MSKIDFQLTDDFKGENGHPDFANSATLPEKVYLVRHGTSEWNEKKRVSGQLDPPLSERGVEQSRVLAQALQNIRLTGIYTSTLSRAADTAHPVAKCQGLPIHKMDGLKEKHMGILQGRFIDHRDTEAQYLWSLRKKNRLEFQMPGGETYANSKHRVTHCLRNILEKEVGGTILIVGHRNTNRVILEALFHWQEEEAVKVNPRSKYLYEIVPGAKPQCNTICLENDKIDHVLKGFVE